MGSQIVRRSSLKEQQREGKRVESNSDGNYCPNLGLVLAAGTAYYGPRVTMPLPAHHTKHLNTLPYPIGHNLTVNL